MADKKIVKDGVVIKDTATVKIMYKGRVIVFKSGTPPPEPPADNSVPWMSFF